MPSPPDTDTPKLTLFGDEQWESLIAWMDEKEVVPVVGPELVTVDDPDSGETMSLELWLARKLREKLGTDGEIIEGKHGPMDQVVRAHLESGGAVKQIYPLIRNLLRDNSFAPPAALRKLAEITDFNLYITTTFDSLMKDAINSVRFDGADATDVFSYAPNKVEEDS